MYNVVDKVTISFGYNILITVSQNVLCIMIIIDNDVTIHMK